MRTVFWRRIANDLKNRPSLKRDIAVLLVVKLILMIGIWALWFSHPMPKDASAENTARMLLNK
jgi:nitrate reductase gamma subunit